MYLIVKIKYLEMNNIIIIIKFLLNNINFKIKPK